MFCPKCGADNDDGVLACGECGEMLPGTGAGEPGPAPEGAARMDAQQERTLALLAHVLVLYEASITGSPKPPTLGVDSFQLIRRDGNWRVVSITNEVVTPSRPIPPQLRD